MDKPATYAHIPGWGADLDVANRPAYPRERTPPRLDGIHWDEPEAQTQYIEVLRSTERPAMTPLFGTGPAPSGLSGMVRRYAFRFSENDLRHWLLLLAADRINMGEGLVSDLSRGHLPNIYAEMGGRAELRHNPLGAVRKVLWLGAAGGLCYLALRSGKRRRQSRL